jgi:hypothetical protein
MPLIQALKPLCWTDGPFPGTLISDLKRGFDSMTVLAGLDSDYVSILVPGPSFQLIKDSVMASNDVILLLGFYEPNNGTPDDCSRLGGHYVTCAGVCTEETDICISDPYFDKNEYEPPAGSAHGSWVHNDADFVSGPHGTEHHDRYHLTPYSIACNTPATERVTNYPSLWTDLVNFVDQNWFDASVLPGPYMGGAIVVMVDYAMIITNVGGSGPCDCDPGNANGDALTNIFDITYLISYLYKGGSVPTPYAICSGDPNCDCLVNIFDITYLISYLYKSGPPPCDCPSWLSACGPPLR